MTALLLLRKDLRILRRSPLLVALLVAYPLVVAGLVGLVAGYASSKPRVALVDEDHLPARVVVGHETFDVNATIARVSRDVHLVRLSPEEAARELRTGKVAATVRTGLPTAFSVEARIGENDTADVAVIVESGATGNVLVAPFLAPSSSPLPGGATIEVLFFDDLSCSNLNLDRPPKPAMFRMFSLEALGDTAGNRLGRAISALET